MRKLEEELKKYAESGMYPFHMPGHKRRGGDGALKGAYACDITEITGFDNLHDPQGILRGEMDFAARLFGARETCFSVNGSTCACLASISAAVPRGGTILIERRCHISVYHAAYLRQLTVRYLEEPAFLAGGAKAEEMLAAADAVVITSPSYEGEVKDVEAYAKMARAHGAVLIVDEAHGAHFSFHPYFPASAIRKGADLVIQSLHKTLPVLTQGALLHNASGAVRGEDLQYFLDVYETSSPSYLLLMSMTRAIHQIAEEGSAYFDAYAAHLKSLRASLSGLAHLQLLPPGDAAETGRYDPGKILISTAGCSSELSGEAFSGSMLSERLREAYRIESEMTLSEAVLFMTSPADTDEGFARLLRALRDIDASLSGSGNGAGRVDLPADGSALPPVRMTIAEAKDAPAERLPLAEAVGRVAADFIIAYPPDVPVVVPGEVLTEEAAAHVDADAVKVVR